MSVGEGATLDGPKRLHPATIGYRLATSGLRVGVILLFLGVPSVTGMFGSGRSLEAVGFLVLAFLAIVAIAGYIVASYRRFEYELTVETFDIRSGVFSRREREIPLRRVQNVDISQNPIHRALGIAEVRLETAGGGSTEAELQFVSVEEADRLQSTISRLRRGGDDDTTAAAESTDVSARGKLLFEMHPRELAVLALVSVDLRIASFLAVGGGLVMPSMPQVAVPPVPFDEFSLSALFGPVVTLAGLVLLALLSGVINAARYYGFRLTRDDGELRYERGLLQRYSGTIPLSKVQTLTIQENAIARRLGYASLTIETAGYAPGAGGAEGSQSAVPLARTDRVRSLARSIEDVDAGSFTRPPRRARTRYGVRYSLVVAVIVAALWLGRWAGVPVPPWYVGLLGLAVVPAAAHLTWANRGYAVGENHIVTRSGFWVRRTSVVPYHRVQTVSTHATVFQRRRDLATLVVDTAGSHSLLGDDAMAVDIDADTAATLREAVPESLSRALARGAGSHASVETDASG